MAKKAEDALIAGFNRAYSNREDRENEYSNGIPLTEGRIHITQPIYYRCGQEGESKLL